MSMLRFPLDDIPKEIKLYKICVAKQIFTKITRTSFLHKNMKKDDLHKNITNYMNMNI